MWDPPDAVETMSLDFVKKTYEKLGRDDPFYAVLTVDRFRGNRWDTAEFFSTGRTEISGVLDYVKTLGVSLSPGRALDFGCGVGRLSQALAEHFQGVVGIDIAESMVERARELNQHGDRVTYLVNSVDDLSILETGTFDFIYSNITLQHVPPEASSRYIAEFLRLLRPGAIAIFQVPNGKPYPHGSWQEWSYRLRRQYVRRLWKIVRGKPPYEMHYLPRGDVEQIVARAGGRMLDIVDVGHRAGSNLRYCATKP